MLELWIMRHGEAADPGSSSDFDRPLTERGRQQVSSFASWLSARNPPPEQILHSPLCRARQTAQQFATGWRGSIPVTELPVLSPGMSAERLLGHFARSVNQRVLCIGHQPDIGRCVSEMIGGGRCSVAPGFCAAIEFRSQIVPGAGALLWIADPNWFG